MLKRSVIFLCLILLFSCGKNVDEKTADAVLSANIALSKGDCQVAIDTLEGNGRVNDNAAYLKTLSSAYACRAGYSTVTFFANDISLTPSPAPLGGTTLYSTSKVTIQNPLQNDASFRDLQKAIDILLYAGGIASTTEPTVAERAKYFTALEAGDINAQLMYMILVQMGKYMHVYGNVSAAGVKGGAGGSQCFTDYPNVDLTDPGRNGNVTAALAANPGACKVKNSSHAQTDSTLISATTRKTRLCQGVVLLNGFFNVLPGVVASASGSLATAISGSTAAVNAAKTALTTAYPGIGAVTTTINQSACEDNSIVPIRDLESYFAIMFESVLQ